MIVVHASVLTNAFTDDGPVGAHSRAELARDAHWAAPEHLVVEVFSAVRGRCLGQKVTERRAREALAALATSTIDLVAATPLLQRMWELRTNVWLRRRQHCRCRDLRLRVADGRRSPHSDP